MSDARVKTCLSYFAWVVSHPCTKKIASESKRSRPSSQAAYSFSIALCVQGPLLIRMGVGSLAEGLR